MIEMTAAATAAGAARWSGATTAHAAGRAAGAGAAAIPCPSLIGESRDSDADSDALTEEFASDALLASKLREIADGAVETILGSQREEGGFKDMLVSSLILMRRGEGGIDSEAAELESEIAAAKRTRMREAELKRKLGI